MSDLRAIVVRYQSGFYTLHTEAGEEVTAKLRGRLKRGPKTGDLVAVGDWVRVSMQPDGRGMIEEVEERRSKLSRLAPTARGEYEQILIANLDQALFIFACADPEPRLRMLDRFLIIAEQQAVPAVIVANKIDLVGGERGAKAIFGHYADLNYRVLYTSAASGKGVKDVRTLLQGKISILAGPSGVGKSSLLNVIQPQLGLQVGAVSEATGKGTHTTTVREMFPLADGGYVADTPGLKSLGLWDIEPEELDGYFPEIAPLVWQCAYSDCSHIEEEGCAVQAAVAAGKVHPERYESYVRLREGAEGDF